MKILPWGIGILLTVVLGNCDEKDHYSSSCAFAPAQSKWQTVDCTTCNWSCVDCFVNIHFLGDDYAFRSDQIERYPHIYCNDDNCAPRQEYYRTAFFEALQAVPARHGEVQGMVGTKTPLAEFDSQWKADTEPEFALRIRNYCNTAYDQLPGQPLADAYNLVTGVSLADSGRYVVEGIPVKYANYNYTGEIKGVFMVDGKAEILTAAYQLRLLVEEPI